MFFTSRKNPVSGSIIVKGGESQFAIVGYRLSFDDDREPEVLEEGTEIYIEHQTQCLHTILPGTQQETLYFEVLGCPVVGLTCYKSTWKGPFGPFKDVVKLGDFDVGKHEFVYEPKYVPDSMRSRGHFKMHVSFFDGNGRHLWQHKRKFNILKKPKHFCDSFHYENGDGNIRHMSISPSTQLKLTLSCDAAMQNESGQNVDLYIPRKCSWTNRILNAKDHASVQIAVADVDPTTGKCTGTTSTFALAGYLRRIGEADEALVSLISKSAAD